MLGFDERSAMFDLFILMEIVEGVHPRDWNTERVERLADFVRRHVSEYRVDRHAELLRAFNARGQGREARIFMKFTPPPGAEQFEQLFGEEDDLNLTVLCVKDLKELREFAVVFDVVAEQGSTPHHIGPVELEGSVDHRDRQILSPSGLCTLKQRSGDSLRRGERSHLVKNNHLNEFGLGPALQRSCTGRRLDQRIVDPAVFVRAIGAIARNGGIDEARVARRQRFSSKPECIQLARAVVLDEGVGGVDEGKEDLLLSLVLEVETHRLLVAVQHSEDR